MKDNMIACATGSMLVRNARYTTEGDCDMPALDVSATNVMKQPEGKIISDILVETHTAATALTENQLIRVDRLASAIIGNVFQCDQCPAKGQLCSGLTQEARRSETDQGLYMYGGEAHCSPKLTEQQARCMRPDSYEQEISVPAPASPTSQS